MKNMITQILFGQSYDTNPIYVFLLALWGGCVSVSVFLLGSWYLLIPAMIVIFTLNTLSGIQKSRKKGIASSDGFAKLIDKSIVYFLFFGLSCAIDWVLQVFLLNGSGLIEVPVWLADLATNPFAFLAVVVIIARESWSLIENLDEMSPELIPPILRKVIQKLKETFSGESIVNGE